MSAAMTNCGVLGWVADGNGYRYDAFDPDSGCAWPEMPDVFSELATRAVAEAGFDSFTPDAYLINRYAPGAHLTLHQDRTNGTSRRLSSPYHSDFPQSFYSAACNGARRPAACR